MLLKVNLKFLQEEPNAKVTNETQVGKSHIVKTSTNSKSVLGSQAQPPVNQSMSTFRDYKNERFNVKAGRLAEEVKAREKVGYQKSKLKSIYRKDLSQVGKEPSVTVTVSSTNTPKGVKVGQIQ